jgi:carbonic anhydrase
MLNIYSRHLSALALGLIVIVSSVPTSSAPAPGPTPDAALQRLRDGNERFAADASQHPSIAASRRKALATGQEPFATVLSCADSRVPPEIVFNVGLGDLFVVRSAGEVVDKSVLASVEYAVEHLHTPLVVVMGHEFCGAVKAASATSEADLGPNLTYLVGAIKPAVERTRAVPEADRLRAAILANVEQVVNNVVEQSAIVRHHLHEKKIAIVGGYYELVSGRVSFSSAVSGETASGGAAASKHR